MSANIESVADKVNIEKSATVESAENLHGDLVFDEKTKPDTSDVVNQSCVEDGTNMKLTTNKKSQNIESDLCTNNMPVSGITIVNTGTQAYTKILSGKNFQLPSFTATQISKCQELQDNRSKRLKEDPHLRHLQLSSNTKKEGLSMKAPLLRSTSMPVCVEVDSDIPEKQVEEKPDFIHHRKIFRTGSVSDYTKQRLKTSILMKTSASLVRKPSITDFEMRQIQGDADSSQSDDEDEDEDDRGVRFKPVIDVEKDASTTGGDVVSSLINTSCLKNALDASTTCVVSSLSESNVNLAVAMTSA